MCALACAFKYILCIYSFTYFRVNKKMNKSILLPSGSPVFGVMSNNSNYYLELSYNSSPPLNFYVEYQSQDTFLLSFKKFLLVFSVPWPNHSDNWIYLLNNPIYMKNCIKVINYWPVKSWHFIWLYHQKYFPQGQEYIGRKMNWPCIIKPKNAPGSTAKPVFLHISLLQNQAL